MRSILALLPLLFFGCLPNRLVPHDFSIEKNNREAYIEVDSISVALENLQVKGDHFVFMMEIQNNSDEPIFIDLNKIQKYAHHLSYREDERLKMSQEVTNAMSLTQVNEFFESKKRDAEAAAFLLFLVGAAVSTYDAIKDDEDNKKEYWTKEDEKKSNTREVMTSLTLAATDVLTGVASSSAESAETELRYLPEELFDREVIYPNESYRGKILFKRFGDLHKYHRISCPIEGDRYHFDFRKATPQEKRFLNGQGY